MAHIWEAIPCIVENFNKQNSPSLTITKKKSDLGLPKSAFGLPGWEDSEATTAIKIARENFPFFSQTCNNVSKANKISALDKVS